MKKTNYLTTLLFAILIILGACKPDPPAPEPTEEEVKLESLSTSTWIYSSVTLDGVEPPIDFSAFTITLSNNFTYSITGNPANTPWPSTSGEWDFKTDDLNTVIRQPDGVEITTTVTDTSLKLEFDYTPPTGGRVSGITGRWVFNMIPQ